MAPARVRPLVLECLQEGGLVVDQAPTEVDPKTDAIDAAGFYVQSPTGPAGGDTKVLYGRAGAVAQVVDSSGSLTLAQAVSVSGAPGGAPHPGLRDSAHFLAGGGPGEGFVSGACQVVTYVPNSPLVASISWYASAAASAPLIYSESYAYSGQSPLPGSATYKTYDASGNQLTAITDTFAYNGPTLTGVTRTH